MTPHSRKSLYFTGKNNVEIREGQVPTPEPGCVLVETLFSGISAGTELLVYRDEIPDDVSLDDSIGSLKNDARYPLKYGYALTGKIVALSDGVDPDLADQHVFAFHPHESHFSAAPDDLIVLPESIKPEDAIFLANMETALNLVMDGQPLIGEAIGIFGQGMVGLLVTTLLADFPYVYLITTDNYPLRRKASIDCGASHSIDPADGDPVENIREILRAEKSISGLDLGFVLSGSPEAMDTAIHAVGYEGRVIAGSWYGDKLSQLHLDTYFHRNKIRIISSQVSQISSALTGRWHKKRRMNMAIEALQRIKPSRFITHKFSIEEAPAAYQTLSHIPEEALQIILTYQ